MESLPCASALYSVPHVTGITSLEGRPYHSHFTDSESKAQRSVVIQL